MFWQIAVGATLSSTVTVAVQVEVFPLTSVTVKVTVFGPTLAQVKLVISKARLWIPHASLLPLSICAAVIVALPDASNCTVMFWQIAVGAILSSTVTVAVQVDVFPFTSVTVKVTVFGPPLAQVQLVISSDRLWIPHASLLPLSICAAVIVAVPAAFSCTVMF